MSAIDEEEEILLSIFPEEFEKVNTNTFKIRIDIDSTECRVASPPTLYLVAQLPPSYPDVTPILHLESTPSEDGEDLTASERDAVLRALNETSEENLGMAMVFTLASTLKECVITALDDRCTAREAEAKAAKERIVRAEQARFEGTKVTVESFMAWHATFMAETARRVAEEDELARKQAVKAGLATAGDRKAPLTGRQLFEGDTTLAQSDLKIGEATDVEFDFSKYDKTTRRTGDDDEDDGGGEVEVRHWAAE